MGTISPGLAEQIAAEHDTSRFHETILQGLAKVMQDQLDFRRDVDTLKDRMVTAAEVEQIISDRFMTRQEFKDQREKDMQLWRRSTRWFYSAISGCGCLLVVSMLATGLLSAGAAWYVSHLFGP